MKNARISTLLLIGGSLFLGGCAALPEQGSGTPAATLPATALPATAANYAGADSVRGSTETIVPEKMWCPSRIAAEAACQSYVAVNGGHIEITSGTPSMEPLIHGQTYVAVKKIPFESIVRKDLLVYMGRPNASKPERIKILHRAVLHDRYGWLMSGDNNRWSETWDRVTPETYLGVVVALFEFPQT